MTKFHKNYAGITKLSPKNQGYKIFNNRAGEATLFTKFAYKANLDNNDNNLQEIANELPSNYQLALVSDYMSDTQEYSYRCAMFIDYDNQEIIFATAGTRLGLNKAGLNNIIDDVRLIAQQPPLQLNSAKELIDIVVDNLGENAKDFKYCFCGHSLGSITAESSAAYLDIKLRNRGLKQYSNPDQIASITFENPGCHAIIDKMYKDAGYKFDNFKDGSFYVINNRSNIINTLNKQFGKEYTIIPDDQEAIKEGVLTSLLLTIAKFCKRIKLPILNKIFSFLIKAPHLLKDHNLDNFKEVLVNKKGLIREKKGNIIIISNKNEIMTLDEICTATSNVKKQQIQDKENIILEEKQQIKQNNNIKKDTDLANTAKNIEFYYNNKGFIKNPLDMKSEIDQKKYLRIVQIQ